MSVEQASKTLCWVSLLPVVFFSGMWTVFFVNIEFFKQVGISNLAYSIQWDTVEPWQLYMTALISAAPHIVVVWGVLNLRKAFQSFAQSRFFEEFNIVYIKRFSLALIWSVLLSGLVGAITSVLLSLNHPPGEKTLSIMLQSVHVSTLLIGLVFWLITNILIKANQLELENKAFV